MSKLHRATLFEESATIIDHQAFAGDQYLLRVHAPLCAQHALPGSFAHIQCAVELPMRRPLSLMRVDKQAGWVEVLYKAVGHGTRQLAQRKVGETLAWLGPIGKPFVLHEKRPLRLLIGGGVGIPPMVFLADYIRQKQLQNNCFVIMGSEVPFPFTAQAARAAFAHINVANAVSMPLLDDWGVANRLCSLQNYPGCFHGYVTDLARLWLKGLGNHKLKQVELFSCGPHPMLKAVAQLAREFNIPCQVSLEEYMACAVGGCAGCTVLVQTESGPAMKRVCVDGPVFDAYSVFT